MKIDFLTVLITVLALLVLTLPGFFLAKAKLIGERGDKAISAVVLYVCQPALVFNAFQKTGYKPEIALNMLYVAGFAIAVHMIMIAFVSLVFRNKNNDAKINALKFASVFGNCGYMGIPFLQSLFSGAESQGEILVYAGVVIAVFNILTWSLGVYMVTGDKKQISIKNALINPTIIALIIGIALFFIVKVPFVDIAPDGSTLDFILTKFMGSIGYLAEAVTPLAMILIGIKLSKVDLKKLLLDKWAYVASVNKLVVSALVSMLLVAFLPIDPIVKYTIVFLLSMPSATNTVMFAVNFGGDGESASVYVLLSTLFSVITIPLVYIMMNSVFGIVI